MNTFLNGAITMGCLASGLFFLKFWKNTHDRLFALFAVAFWLLALDRLLIVTSQTSEISSPIQYLARLGAFVVIICAIVDKNWKEDRRP
jgi:hypothetical protein